VHLGSLAFIGVCTGAMKGDLKRAEMEALECVQEMAVLMSEEMSTTCRG
jgi:hypothetical protein